MESLHLALGQYERGDLEGTGDCLPHGALLFRHQEPSQRRCVGHAITDSEALEAERGNRTRAEEQLTRCDAAMRRLRDGTAPPPKKKEVLFHDQLAALQQQNAAQLESLEARVTAA
ncbi:hypothetical protein, unknown function [Leishmania braziliensis MHOM/BR/75/M2904]|uniref:Uncharacterized protein n=1 Tax=Leishmania braziliensis TaxID=5660 RepID=A4HGY2_LEIBR|nr:hypothetical protein, unknown function [Leishmania braziliensis MHOM/BR/75/M2904]CAM39830.1 hypothetical protein, unknown function [Leishmania braziliensis MHOM/BR/75/M2904]